MHTKNTIKILADTNRYTEKGRFSKIGPYQKKYLKRYIVKNKKNIAILFVLILVETILVLSLPILNHYYLEKSYSYLNYNKLILGAVIIAAGIIIYLIVSYQSLLKKQKIIMNLVNDIRHYRYSKFIQNPIPKYGSDNTMMVKMLYHVQLLKMGLERIISDGLSTALLFLGIMITTFYINSKLFLILWLVTPVLLAIFLASYFIGKYYITKEQTFNTRIVSHLTETLVNQKLIRRQHRQEERINDLDKLIRLDTYFRIRRQLWIQYSDRVLFGGILLTGLTLYIIQTYWPFMNLQNIFDAATSVIILGLFTKVIYGTSRVGIFMEPFILGLKLCTPKTSDKKKIKIVFNSRTNLKIKSTKTKLSKNGGYIKNLDISIIPGQRILIIGESDSGKSTLARAIAGEKSIQSISFELDKIRLHANQWIQKKKNIYLISADLSYLTSLGSLILGKEVDKINSADITDLYANLGKYQIYKSIFDNKDLLGKTVNTENLSRREKILLQIAHCIVNKKAIIIIDDPILDQENPAVKEALQLLDNKRNESTILIFATKNNDILKYDQKYQITQNRIKKI